jgi:hypothetical protein
VIQEIRQLARGGLVAELGDEPAEGGERGLLPLGDVRDLLGA